MVRGVQHLDLYYSVAGSGYSSNFVSSIDLFTIKHENNLESFTLNYFCCIMPMCYSIRQIASKVHQNTVVSKNTLNVNKNYLTLKRLSIYFFFKSAAF